MKRGKRFFENQNLFIYVGTAIFFVLAIAIGIIMYMAADANSEIGKVEQNVVEEQQIEEDTESASTEMGKTVEEQEAKTENTTTENTTTENQVSKNNNTIAENTTENTTTDTAANNTQSNNNTIPENTPVNSQAENKEVEEKKEITFAKPVEGEVICQFAKDNLIYSETLKEWITHTAIDIKADKTSVVKSAADGIVKSIVNDPRYGLTVVVEHQDGYETVYSNLLTAEFVVEGEEITQGQTIGTVGNTAAFESSMESHLHFELLQNGEYLDPSIYLK